MKNRILINAQLLTIPNRGMGVFLLNVIKNLNEAINFELVVNGPILNKFNSEINIKEIRSIGIIFEQLIFPIYTIFFKSRFIVHSGNSCSIIPCRGREILLIHDVSFLKPSEIMPEANSLKRKLGRFYRKLTIKAGVRRATKIITVSEFAKKDILKEFPYFKGEIILVPNAINKPIDPDPSLSKNRASKICFISGTDAQKNLFPTLDKLQAYIEDNNLGWIIEVIGVDKLDSPKKYPNNFIFHGYLKHSDAIAICFKSQILCLPSLYESFGIPALEGYSCGCKLVLSNKGAPKSIFGNRAYYFDPYSFEGFFEAINSAIADTSLTDNNFVDNHTWKKSSERLQAALN